MFLQKSHLIWNLSEILWRCTMVVQPHISNTHYVIRHRNYLRNSSAETFIKQPSATTRHQLGRIVSRRPGPVRCTMLRLFGPVRSSDRGDRGGGTSLSSHIAPAGARVQDLNIRGFVRVPKSISGIEPSVFFWKGPKSPLCWTRSSTSEVWNKTLKRRAERGVKVRRFSRWWTCTERSAKPWTHMRQR